jgi:hypothetical protein
MSIIPFLFSPSFYFSFFFPIFFLQFFPLFSFLSPILSTQSPLMEGTQSLPPSILLAGALPHRLPTPLAAPSPAPLASVVLPWR